jgi:hypothetical protein
LANYFLLFLNISNWQTRRNRTKNRHKKVCISSPLKK